MLINFNSWCKIVEEIYTYLHLRNLVSYFELLFCKEKVPILCLEELLCEINKKKNYNPW